MKRANRKNQLRAGLARLLPMILGALVCTGLGALLLVWTLWLGAPGSGGETVEVEVPAGVGA